MGSYLDSLIGETHFSPIILQPPSCVRIPLTVKLIIFCGPDAWQSCLFIDGNLPDLLLAHHKKMDMKQTDTLL